MISIIFCIFWSFNKFYNEFESSHVYLYLEISIILRSENGIKTYSLSSKPSSYNKFSRLWFLECHTFSYLFYIGLLIFCIVIPTSQINKKTKNDTYLPAALIQSRYRCEKDWCLTESASFQKKTWVTGENVTCSNLRDYDSVLAFSEKWTFCKLWPDPWMFVFEGNLFTCLLI